MLGRKIEALNLPAANGLAVSARLGFVEGAVLHSALWPLCSKITPVLRSLKR
jgi:hypothetical protein